MIQHNYLAASDNIAQYVADELLPGKNNTRQEVTAEWYLRHMIDAPLFAWTSDDDYHCGLDPWRFEPDIEDALSRGWRLFVQRKDMPVHLRTQPHDAMAKYRTPSLYGITGSDGKAEAFTADRKFVAQVEDKDAGGAIIRAINSHDKLVTALEAVTKELREIVKDEKCDHGVGICWCSTFTALDQADEVLKAEKE